MRAASIPAIVVLSVVTVALATPPAAAKVFHYSATTEKTFAQPEAVHAGVFNWQCEGHECKINGPWEQPGVGLCKMLAKVVGKITAFGHPEAKLDDAQLAECNQATPPGSSAARP